MIGMQKELRTSSVFGLKEVPKTATTPPPSSSFVMRRVTAGEMEAFCAETDEINGTCRPTEVCRCLKRSDVLGQAWTGKTNAGIQVPAPQAGIHEQGAGNIGYVRPEPFADLRELIYEGNTRREQRIGAVLDHLGGVGIGINELPGQSGKQTTNFSRYVLTRCADNGSKRLEEIGDGISFGHELRVRDELDEAAVAAQKRCDKSLKEPTGMVDFTITSVSSH